MAKRGADFDNDFDDELKKMCTETKCDICVVPISGKEQGDKHYSGKIHKKKVEKWKESWLSFKKTKTVKTEGGNEANSNGGSVNGTSNGVKVEANGDDGPEKSTQDRLLALSAAPIDPKTLDSMDPTQMKQVINPKKKNRWGEEDESRAAPPEDDPLDFSFPDTYEKAMYMCFNPKTGIGYCQICNVMDRYEKKVKKHFRSGKHAGKLEVYNEQIASEAAVLAGSAAPNPPPHRGFFCEVCEADCSSEAQLEQHMTGDRHRTNLRLMESALAADPELDKDINPYNLPELWLRDRKHCYMCDVQLSSLRMATIHFNSRDHRRAAGLRVSEASKNAEWLNEGDLHCDVCNFRVKTEIEMRTHEAGIRHLENEKTKLAVEGAGGTWSCSFPSPLPPPKYSVQDPGVGWTGESIGVSAEMVNMMDSMSGQAGFGGQNGWIPGQGPMGGHMGRNPMYPGPNGPAGGRGPPQWYHMQPQPQEHSFMNPKVIELRRYAGVDVSGLHCKCCDVRFTDKDQLEQHLELPDHMEKAKDIPHEELSYQAMNPEDYVPVPITGDSMSSVRTKQNSLHCPFCKVWFPSVTILIYYHSIREEHKENIARYVAEKQTEGEMLECQACRIKAATPEQLWDECIRLQKGKIFGRTRTYSCDKCDVHLSEIEWLQKHFQGEKHDYISKRVDQLLPVQWEPQEMVVVQKMDFDQFTYQYSYYPEWQCLVCKVGFAGIDKYKKHLTTLFHMRKCAGEPGLRFDPNNRPMKCLTRKQRAEVLAEAV